MEPSENNGLKVHSMPMIDKITTIPRTKLGRRLGELGSDDLERVNDAIVSFLGIIR